MRTPGRIELSSRPEERRWLEGPSSASTPGAHPGRTARSQVGLERALQGPRGVLSCQENGYIMSVCVDWDLIVCWVVCVG